MTTASGITIVSASAGSGKTFKLTQVVSRAVEPANPQRIALEGLLAVTYTKKADAELTTRIRKKLVSEGAIDEALRLPLAYVGTVHATCLRLLQEFAVDAGLSPQIDVVGDAGGRLLRQALEASLDPGMRAKIERLASLFKLRWSGQWKRTDWVTPVADIMDLARSNRIAPDALYAMADRAVAGLTAVLPEAGDADALDEAFRRELAAARAMLAGSTDATAKTAEVRADVETAHDAMMADDLDWPTWAKMFAVEAAKATDPALEPLRRAASGYATHPRFQAELVQLTRLLYEAAAVGLGGYRLWKEDRRVVDYVDLLDRAFDVVQHPRVATELRERLELAVVDEFQDTSPIQLALFVRLHQLAGRSVWVGDRKQCIFEYAGADPRLMDDVVGWVRAAGGAEEALQTNYRSRPDLVEACSAIFAAALARHGFRREEVVVGAGRSSGPELPPFGVWAMQGRKEMDAIAAGVARMLQDAAATPIVDRITNEVRPVRAGDIAVLVATNVEAAKLAAALHARGLRASYARAGLLETPEGTLVDASLRWLVDRRDSLSAAKLDALFDFDADTWLTQQLARTPEEAPWQGMLEPLRTRLSVFSPREAVDEVLRAVDVVRLCERWPNPAQRVANLDALRALVMDYEDRHCPNERESATVAGLLRFFDTVGTPTLRRDEMVASDDQHVALDEGSVVVTTYHRSKGLEWPVVVLGSLNKKEKRDVFEVLPESDGRAFDPERPLEGRWIRYWPGREVKAAFVDAIERSPEAQRVADREERERARLLYVGFTRARDHLVLAVGVTVKEATRRSPENVTAKCVWLDTLADESGAPLLRLPVDARDGATGAVALATGGAWPARVWRVNDQAPAHAEARPEVRQLLDRGSSTAEARTYRIRPSNAADDWPDLPPPVLGEVVTLPGSLPVEGKVADDGALGDAVHAFFAADVVADRDARLARARRTLGGLVGQIRPEAMLDASDRLRAFVGARWPAARWHREIPVAARTDDGRAVGGTMDLLLETEQGWVLLDHKTFPARSEAAWRAKLDEFRPQMAAYARSLALTGRAVKEAWIHLPVGGGLVQLVWR